MGGPCQLRIYAKSLEHSKRAIGAAITEIERLEQKYSRYRKDSLLTRINRSAGTGNSIVIDVETAGLFNYADTLCHESGGLFDPTAGILRRVWDFKSGSVPTEAAVQQVLPLIGWQQLIREGRSVTLPHAGMELDLGGCVKEYACDSVVSVLHQAGIAHGLIELAGDIAVVGPQPNGDPWSIGIRHPRNKTAAIAQIPLRRGGLASSGDYERCVEIAGERYGHILNPHTGWPVKGLVSVTVLAEQCLVAGSSATLGMLLPQEEALEWLSELGLPWLAVDQQSRCYGSVDP